MQEGFVFCQMIYDTSGKPDDWIYLNVNPAFNRLTGLADIVGRRVTDAIPGIKDQTPELFKTYSRVAQTGQPEKFEIHFTPLGIWLSISVFSPEKEYFVAVFDDITIRKQVEEKLLMSGEKFRLLVECAPHAIYIQTRSRFTYLNPEALRLFGASSPDELLAKLVIERFSPEDYAIVEDRIRLLNIAAEQLFGWSEAEIIGKTVSYTPPEKRLEYEAIKQRIRSGEAIRGIELQRVTKDGRKIDIHLFAAPLHYNKGTISGVLAIIEDITERKEVVEALAENRRILDTLMHNLPGMATGAGMIQTGPWSLSAMVA